MKKILPFICCLITIHAASQAIYEMPLKTESRLSSFENPNGIKGNGGKTNKTAKGNAFEVLRPGETKMLLNITGEGIIQRIWMTIEQDPVTLRSLRLQMFWDGNTKAAVDVPMGDFFCYNLGKPVAFQSALFTSGEGRSFVCYIAMPFRKGARVQLVNEGSKATKLFYDIDFVYQKMPANTLYFHACWTRQTTGKPGDDFQVLPKVKGKGRFLGMSVGLNTDSSYERSWWGEGEVKMFLDGDSQYPTIAGTGAEDYVGSAWGLGTFHNQYQGCTVASDSLRQFSFYRWHVPDQVFFYSDIRITLQQIGGWGKEQVKALYNKGAKLVPITIDGPHGFTRLLDMPNAPSISDPAFADGWVNFYRIDDYSAVSYFYLDKPSSQLPALAPVLERIANVR